MRPAVGWLWLIAFTLLAAPEAVAGGSDGLPLAYSQLDPEGIASAVAAVQSALEQAKSRDLRGWRHGSSSGVVTPLRTFRISDGRYCRDYLEVVLVPGQPPAYGRGTACRSARGLWEPLEP